MDYEIFYSNDLEDLRAKVKAFFKAHEIMPGEAFYPEFAVVRIANSLLGTGMPDCLYIQTVFYVPLQAV